jgi:hypothetical protein
MDLLFDDQAAREFPLLGCHGIQAFPSRGLKRNARAMA